MKYDIAVIGSGMSGLMASIYLAEQGLNTAIVSRGDPICSVSSGCIDIAGTGKKTLDSIDNFPEEHPYNKVGEKGISYSIHYFLNIMKDEGCDYTGNFEKNRNILTPIVNIELLLWYHFPWNMLILEKVKHFILFHLKI